MNDQPTPPEQDDAEEPVDDRRCHCSNYKNAHTYNAGRCPTNRWMHPR